MKDWKIAFLTRETWKELAENVSQRLSEEFPSITLKSWTA